MPIDELFALYPLAFVITALLLGLVVGSFLNVLIWRLPKMLERDWRQQAQDVLGLPSETPLPTYNLMLPHSQCPHCAHRIRPWENLPVISYLLPIMEKKKCRRSRCGLMQFCAHLPKKIYIHLILPAVASVRSQERISGNNMA